MMSKLMTILFGVEEFSWCPPPLFTITMIISSVSVYISHVIAFIEAGKFIDWRGPWPDCSVLILNTFQRHH